MENNRILVVDDDPSVRRIICRVLGSEGLSTEEADGGVAAVRMAMSNPYSLIILDLMMDDMDGFQVIHHLRTNGILTPLFVLSGRQAEVDKVLALGIGADAVSYTHLDVYKRQPATWVSPWVPSWAMVSGPGISRYGLVSFPFPL